MDTTTVSVRTALMPLFYKDFHCLAADCKDNCCGGWEIAFSKKDYLRVKHSAQSKELKAILSNGMSRLRDNAFGGYYAHFKVGSEGTCAFQTSEGLCRLQLECGAEALPCVCRDYPRKSVYTPVACEFSLTPSCEGVLALLWDLPQGIDFLEEDLPKVNWRTVEIPSHYIRFADIRSFCIDILQERSLSLVQRMLLLNILLRRLEKLNWMEEGVVDAWLTWGKSQLQVSSTTMIPENLSRDRLTFLIHNLRILMDLYETNAAGAKKTFCSLFSAISTDGENWEEKGFQNFSLDVNRYEALERQLAALLNHTDEFFENLMVLSAFYSTFPAIKGTQELRRSRAMLCGLYSFFRFAAVCSCGQETSRERLFQVLGSSSRGLLHNKARLEKLADIVLEGGDTPSRFAVLVGG